MDTVRKAVRSKIMSRVGQKNTEPEMLLRKALHRLGLRYRLHERTLPGSPDVVFPRFHAALFVHGCFWHSHGCKASTVPKSNHKFWLTKFKANKTRDHLKTEALLHQGWRVMVVWECALKGKKGNPDLTARKVRAWLKSRRQLANVG